MGVITVKKIGLILVLCSVLLFPAQGWAWYDAAVNVAMPNNTGNITSIGSSSGENGRVILLVLDRFPVQYLSYPLPQHFQKLMDDGAMALLNDNTAGGINPESTHLTIGAGIQAKGYGAVAEGFKDTDVMEQGLAGEEYYRRTGVIPPAESLLMINIAKIKNMNETLPYTVEIGALGKEIHKAGLKTAVLGNSDVGLNIQRQALAIAMDEQGMVNEGIIGPNALTPDRDFVGGFRTNYNALLSAYEKLPADVALVVVDLGDISRLHNAQNNLFPERFAQLTQDTLQRMDVFMGHIMAQMDPQKDLLFVVVPTPGRYDKESLDKLSLLFAYGTDIPKGFLMSPTTRRPGVVANTDIAPTILHYLGIASPSTMNGRGMQMVTAEGDTASAIYKMSEQLTLTNESRTYFMRGYVYYQIIVLILSVFCIFLGRKTKQYIKPLLLSVMVVPLVFLLLPLLPQKGIMMLVLEFLGLFIVLSWFVNWLKRYGCNPFIVIGLVTAGILLVDTLLGSPLQKTSLLGYDPIGGARYYGIGNEYMGVLIGSLILGLGTLYSSIPKNRYKKVVLVSIGLVFLTATYMMASPYLGTNVGGTIASLAAYLVTFLLLMGIRFRFKTIGMVMLGVILVVVLFVLFDMRRPSALQSHMGRAATLIASGGFEEMLHIIGRKLDTNIRLIKYSIWSRIFTLGLGVFLVLLYQPLGIIKVIKEKSPFVFRSILGVLTGALVALICNDSGIVAAATTMIFGVFPLLYMAFEEKEKRIGEFPRRL